MRNGVRGKRPPSPPIGGFLLALVLAVLPGVAMGQETLSLSSATAVPGGAVTLDLSLVSPTASGPAGLQWTLTYATGSVASIGAVAGSSATAAGKAINCYSSSGSYTCLLSGMNGTLMANGIVAAITMTMATSAQSTAVGLTHPVATTAAGLPISVTGTGGTISVSAPPVQLPTVAGLSCRPTSLTSGNSSTCTVSLSPAAPAGGTTVNLSSSTGALSVPASVAVAAGATSASFAATAGTITTNQSAVVTASYNGSSQTASISLVVPTFVSLLSCSPTSLSSRGTSTCTVTISQPAGSGGIAVTLSSNAAALTMPASVTVAAGATSASFAATAGTITTNQSAVVTASYNGSSQTASISLVAVTTVTTVTLLSCSPTGLSSGGTSTCTVTISQPAGSGGIAVTLSSNAAALTVPVSVSVAAGATSASFTATAGTVTIKQTVAITASLNGSFQTQALYLASAPPALSSLVCTPTSLSSGLTATCVVTLSNAATAGGASIALASSAAALTVPGSVTVLSGATTATFTATAGTISSNQTAVVTASYSGSSQTASISLAMPAAVSSVSCDPDSLGSGQTAACTVTLSQAAASGGVAVVLSSSNAALTVPASVNVAPGSSAANFTATAGTISANQTAVITAVLNGSSQTDISLVAAGSVSLLSCTPKSLTSGGTATCTVTLANPAGSSGVIVVLSSNSPSLSVPSSVTVAAGSSVASFTASAGTVSGGQTAVVTASWNGTSRTASIDLLASGSGSTSIACNPDPNNAGTLDCTISLSAPAPAGGVTVGIQSSTPRVQVPAQVVVVAGAAAAPFVATVASSDQDVQAQIVAQVAGATATATVPIVGVRPTGLSCLPRTIPAGGSFTCAVTMNSPNVPQTARLSATSDNSNLEFPDPFLTRPGQTQLSFEVYATPLAGRPSSIVSVQFGQTAVTDSVVVTSATAPVLTLPGPQLSAFGEPVSFTVSAIDPGGLWVVLSAANLPPGASFDAGTGRFFWRPGAPRSVTDRLEGAHPSERRAIEFIATDSAKHAATGYVTIEVGSTLPTVTDLRNAGSQMSHEALPSAGVRSRTATMSCTPGSVASLMGRWLNAGTQPSAAPTGSSTELAGTQVIVNGYPVPLVYASATRVDFVCPATIAGGELEVSAQIEGAASNAIYANQQATLGLYSVDGSGHGQGRVTFSGTSLLPTPRSYLNNGQPAEPGDTISILSTGAGLGGNPSLLGVSIGGVSATVNHVQAMPGMAGIYRIDVTVPAAAAPGDAVPVVVQVAESSGATITSNTVTIAIEAATP